MYFYILKSIWVNESWVKQKIHLFCCGYELLFCIPVHDLCGKNWTLFILQRFINKLYNLYLYLSLAWMITARVHQNIYRWYYLYNHHPIEKEFRKNVGQFLVNTSIQTAIPVFRVNFCLRVICKKQERYLRYMKTNYKNRPSVYYESIIAKYRNITC